MRPTLAAFAAGLLAAAVALPALAQPANDACASAQFIPLTGTSPANVTGTNAGATPDLANCGCLGGTADDPTDVWYRIVAPATGQYIFDLYFCDFDTTVSVWQGGCAGIASGAPIGCNDDEDPDNFIFTSLLFVNLTAGTEYLVRVSGYGGDTGPIDMDVYFPSAGTITGACCTGSSCTQGSAGACAGTFRGASTTCTPSPCQPASTGVCCRGSACATGVAQAACTAPAGTQAGAAFAAAAAACNTAGADTAPCCKADYNKQGGVELLDIFAFLTDWFASAPWADYDGQNGVDLIDIFSFLTGWFAGGC
jgi:hypothetical protein